jgi:benzodiazapine receptor
MRADEWSWLAIFLVCTLAVAALASAFTASSVNTWYRQLRKPAFNPPAWIFAPVWTTLYLMMALSAWLVWRNAGWTAGRMALTLFFAQLCLNGLWSALFFGLQRPGLAVVEILVLFVAVISTAIAFLPISKLAFWFLVPYAAWVAFASLLNFELWRLNRARFVS